MICVFYRDETELARLYQWAQYNQINNQQPVHPGGQHQTHNNHQLNQYPQYHQVTNQQLAHQHPYQQLEQQNNQVNWHFGFNYNFYGCPVMPHAQGKGHNRLGSEENCPKRPAERQLMRPWLIERINSSKIRGLEWQNKDQMIFRIPWKHGSRHGWSQDCDSYLFEMWAVHTGIIKF